MGARAGLLSTRLCVRQVSRTTAVSGALAATEMVPIRPRKRLTSEARGASANWIRILHLSNAE